MNNGSFIGGGTMTAGEAKIDDGLMTISYIKSFNRFKTIPILVKCKKKKIAQVKERVLFNCKELNIDGKNLTLEYDGNLLEGLDHVNVKLIPSKLRLLTIRK